jgi:hypothetical protein
MDCDHHRVLQIVIDFVIPFLYTHFDGHGQGTAVPDAYQSRQSLDAISLLIFEWLDAIFPHPDHVSLVFDSARSNHDITMDIRRVLFRSIRFR